MSEEEDNTTEPIGLTRRCYHMRRDLQKILDNEITDSETIIKKTTEATDLMGGIQRYLSALNVAINEKYRAIANDIFRYIVANGSDKETQLVKTYSKTYSVENMRKFLTPKHIKTNPEARTVSLNGVSSSEMMSIYQLVNLAIGDQPKTCTIIKKCYKCLEASMKVMVPLAYQGEYLSSTLCAMKRKLHEKEGLSSAIADAATKAECCEKGIVTEVANLTGTREEEIKISIDAQSFLKKDVKVSDDYALWPPFIYEDFVEEPGCTDQQLCCIVRCYPDSMKMEDLKVKFIDPCDCEIPFEEEEKLASRIISFSWRKDEHDTMPQSLPRLALPSFNTKNSGLQLSCKYKTDETDWSEMPVTAARCLTYKDYDLHEFAFNFIGGANVTHQVIAALVAENYIQQEAVTDEGGKYRAEADNRVMIKVEPGSTDGPTNIELMVEKVPQNGLELYSSSSTYSHLKSTSPMINFELTRKILKPLQVNAPLPKEENPENPVDASPGKRNTLEPMDNYPQYLPHREEGVDSDQNPSRHGLLPELPGRRREFTQSSDCSSSMSMASNTSGYGTGFNSVTFEHSLDASATNMQGEASGLSNSHNQESEPRSPSAAQQRTPADISTSRSTASTPYSRAPSRTSNVTPHMPHPGTIVMEFEGDYPRAEDACQMAAQIEEGNKQAIARVLVAHNEEDRNYIYLQICRVRDVERMKIPMCENKYTEFLPPGNEMILKEGQKISIMCEGNIQMERSRLNMVFHCLMASSRKTISLRPVDYEDVRLDGTYRGFIKFESRAPDESEEEELDLIEITLPKVNVPDQKSLFQELAEFLAEFYQENGPNGEEGDLLKKLKETWDISDERMGDIQRASTNEMKMKELIYHWFATSKRMADKVEDLISTMKKVMPDLGGVLADKKSESQELRTIFIQLIKSEGSVQLMRDWKFLAMELGVSDENLHVIEEQHKNDIRQQIYTMLTWWKGKEGHRATKQVLINALKAQHLVQLAEMIESSSNEDPQE